MFVERAVSRIRLISSPVNGLHIAGAAQIRCRKRQLRCTGNFMSWFFGSSKSGKADSDVVPSVHPVPNAKSDNVKVPSLRAIKTPHNEEAISHPELASPFSPSDIGIWEVNKGTACRCDQIALEVQGSTSGRVLSTESWAAEGKETPRTSTDQGKEGKKSSGPFSFW